MAKASDPTTGVATRTWLTSELDEAGVLEFEVYLVDTSSGTVVNTSQKFTREVRDKV